MNAALLEKILACTNLPTLPAAALEVLELCRKQDVHINDLARAICRDPALAIKILRTVNSARYALRCEVTTISHALVLLGINTVKSLALSFSLVGSLKDVRGQDFDPNPIWLRSMFAALSARSIAVQIGAKNPEEAFLAALVQDLGILAFIQALGSPYIDLLRASGEGYAKLVELEREHLQLDHAQVGEALGKAWNLPPALTIPIRFHEDPAKATGDGQRLAYTVALGNKAAQPFLVKDSRQAFGQYIISAVRWFEMDKDAAANIIEVTAKAAPDMGKLLDIPPGSSTHSEVLLAKARDLREELAADHKRASGE